VTNNDSPVQQSRTAEDTTVAELFSTVAPPREQTTGVHVIAVGPNYLLAIQGPEALHMTRLILDFVDTLHEVAESKKNG
jgi:hypothetical protein